MWKIKTVTNYVLSSSLFLQCINRISRYSASANYRNKSNLDASVHVQRMRSPKGTEFDVMKTVRGNSNKRRKISHNKCQGFDVNRQIIEENKRENLPENARGTPRWMSLKKRTKSMEVDSKSSGLMWRSSLSPKAKPFIGITDSGDEIESVSRPSMNFPLAMGSGNESRTASKSDLGTKSGFLWSKQWKPLQEDDEEDTVSVRRAMEGWKGVKWCNDYNHYNAVSDSIILTIQKWQTDSYSQYTTFQDTYSLRASLVYVFSFFHFSGSMFHYVPICQVNFLLFSNFLGQCFSFFQFIGSAFCCYWIIIVFLWAFCGLSRENLA